MPKWQKRKRIPQKAIDEVVRQIAEQFHPQQIILFGSYARENPLPFGVMFGLASSHEKLRHKMKLSTKSRKQRTKSSFPKR